MYISQNFSSIIIIFKYYNFLYVFKNYGYYSIIKRKSFVMKKTITKLYSYNLKQVETGIFYSTF